MNFFDEAYEGTPPWDIGRPQKIFVDLVDQGRLKEGAVLDVGCGTGEHVLFLASRGFDVTGIDFSPKAIEKAKGKAAERGLKASFQVGDALHLTALKRTFATVIDNGLFHTFDDEEREVFSDQIAKALRPGGTYFMACFSDKEPSDWGGPRRVTKAEIRSAFPSPFRVRSIEDVRFETRFHDDGGGHAYLATIDRP